MKLREDRKQLRELKSTIIVFFLIWFVRSLCNIIVSPIVGRHNNIKVSFYCSHFSFFFFGTFLFLPFCSFIALTIYLCWSNTIHIYQNFLFFLPSRSNQSSTSVPRGTLTGGYLGGTRDRNGAKLWKKSKKQKFKVQENFPVGNWTIYRGTAESFSWISVT